LFKFCGAECWTLLQVDQKYLKSSEMLCQRRMEKMNWTDRLRRNEVLHRSKRREIPYIWWKVWRLTELVESCVGSGHIIEGKIQEMIKATGRRRKRSKLLLDDLKEKRRCWKLKQEAPDRTMWRTRVERVSGSVVREAMERMNEWMSY